MRSKKAGTEMDKAAETVAPKPCKPVREMPELFFEDSLRGDLKRSDFPRGFDGRIAWCKYQQQLWHERCAQLIVERRKQIEEQRAAIQAHIKTEQHRLDMLTCAQSQNGE